MLILFWVTAVSDDLSAPGVAEGFALHQNYPNPINPTTTIAFVIPTRSFLTLKVFDALGERVAVLVNGPRGRGTYSALFDGEGLPSGTYLYRLKTGGSAQARTMTLVR